MKKPGGSKSGITDKERLFYEYYLMILIYLVISEIRGV